MTSRRRILGGIAAAALLPSKQLYPSDVSAKIIVIGGGFAGATVARFLKRHAPRLQVTLIEPNPIFTACPFSNLVITGQRNLSQQQFSYRFLEAEGITVLHERAMGINTETRQVALQNRDTLTYDKLVAAPGISLQWNAIQGYDQSASQVFPHAWLAGPQTMLLRQQIMDMRDGGLIIIGAPPNPFRCPPGPYERASLVANYLTKYKPKSKVLILDPKDNFSKKSLFLDAWKTLYGGMVEWVGASDGGNIVEVRTATKTIKTDFDTFQPDVANIIPPQSAGTIAQQSGFADASGWCPIDPLTFESNIHNDVHILGDAAIANAMPKSAFSANAQAKVCALQLKQILSNQEPISTTLANTCYSLVAPDYGISIAGVYRPGKYLDPVPGAGGISPRDAKENTRKLEARYARDWFRAITSQTFG